MKNLTMETVADMAGVRAKETDKVSIEFTKEEVELLMFALDFLQSCNFIDKEIPIIQDKLENANPEWTF